MGDQRRRDVNRLRHPVRKPEGKLALLIMCVTLVFGCLGKMPSEDQIQTDRVETAKQNLEEIRPPSDIQFEHPLTLEDVIRIGLRNNLELRVRDLQREIADKETLAQKLQMLPDLTADATYSYRDKLRKSDVYNWETDTDETDTTVSELKDSFKANLTLTWNVLDTLIAYAKGSGMEMREFVLEKRKERQAQKLALDITNAYWEAAALEDALDYVHTVETRMLEIKSNMNRAVEMGQLDRMDAAEAEMRLKELELTIRQLQSNLSKARLELAQLMGLNQNVQFTLARPPIRPIVSALPHPKELDVDRLEENALTNRPDLFESDMQVRIQQVEAKAKMLDLFPGLRFFASTHYDDNRLLYSNTWNSFGAGLGWELLDLPSKIAVAKGSEKAVEMAKTQRLLLTVGVITEVHIALLDYAIKVDRFRLLEDTYKLSSNLLNMAIEKNQAGRLPQLEVTQRHLEEMAAKLRRDEAVVELLTAHKRLCVTLGMAPLECDTSVIGRGTTTGGEYSPVSTGITEETAGGTLKRWKCTECGYIHTGYEPPSVCPVCGVGPERFVEVPFEEEDLSTRKWSGGSRSLPPSEAAQGTAGSPGWAGGASDRFMWKVQIGSFVQPGAAREMLDRYKDLDLMLMDARDATITTKRVRGKLFNRVRVRGLTQAQARQVAQALSRHGMEYWIIPPHSTHY